MAWWQGGGEGDLPLPVKTSILLALHPDLVDLSKAGENGDILVSKYRFLGDPRYGVGAVFGHHHFTVTASTRPGQMASVSAEIGEQLITIWAEKFAVVLREMQAKSHLAGRYRSDAYRSGQP